MEVQDKGNGKGMKLSAGMSWHSLQKKSTCTNYIKQYMYL